MKTYTGNRTDQGYVVTVDGMPLGNEAARISGDLLPFEWGNSGVCSGALAWSILVDALESDNLAKEYCDAFRMGVVANWITATWTITQGEVWRWLIKQCERCYDNVRRRGPSHIIV